jgi:hypothetical protein
MHEASFFAFLLLFFFTEAQTIWGFATPAAALPRKLIFCGTFRLDELFRDPLLC